MRDDRQSAVGPDPEFGAVLVNQIFDLWVGPEMERRGLSLNRTDVRKILVEMEPDHPPRVLINSEADLEVQFVARRDIAEGEEISLGDVDELSNLRPVAIGPNSGWICFARIGNHEYVAFDFTYNRARAAALLDRAREFLTVASIASQQAPGVAIDNAHSAAELAVQAQMLVQQAETTGHRERRQWFAGWAEHQNAPKHHADLLWNLADLRAHARYGSDELRLKPARLATILVTVQEMIDQASVRIYNSPS